MELKGTPAFRHCMIPLIRVKLCSCSTVFLAQTKHHFFFLFSLKKRIAKKNLTKNSKCLLLAVCLLMIPNLTKLYLNTSAWTVKMKTIRPKLLCVHMREYQMPSKKLLIVELGFGYGKELLILSSVFQG